MDLHAPLDRRPPKRRRRVAPIAAVFLVILGLGGLGAYLLRADPKGGEPYAVANIPPTPAPKSAPPDAGSNAADPTPTGSLAKAKASSEDTVRYENGVKVVSPSENDARRARDTGPLVIDVSKALDSDARKLAAVGRSKKDPVTSKDGPRPRIAIFVGGLGLSETATRTAVEIMPPAVTLAFVPYGDTLATLVGMARARGHEILLQLPMQNSKGPPLGPHTLNAEASSAQTTGDLDWLMSRVDGYVGVTNLLGAPVTANAATLTTVLKSVHDHGVFYVDDGTSKRSLAMSLAPSVGVSALQADVILDATADPNAVRANLDRLTALARKKGAAVGVASGLADHLATVARFASELDSHGIALVPVSTLAHSGTSTAIAR